MTNEMNKNTENTNVENTKESNLNEHNKPNKPIVNCTNCGKKIEYGTNICPHCGAEQLTSAKILVIGIITMAIFCLPFLIIDAVKYISTNKNTKNNTSITVTTAELTSTYTELENYIDWERVMESEISIETSTETETEVDVEIVNINRNIEVPTDEEDVVEIITEELNEVEALTEFEVSIEAEIPTELEVPIEPERNILTFYKSSESNFVHINANCGSVQNILEENLETVQIYEDELDNYSGIYQACGRCSKRFNEELPHFD